MSVPAVELPMTAITDFCQKWRVAEFALFGSVLTPNFGPESDIDVMVKFTSEASPTFCTLDEMESELKAMFEREVDLITREGIEMSQNYLRRHEILSSAQVIYATGCGISAGYLAIG